MRKVVLYIATSLDGFVADKNGSVAWIAGEDKNNQDMGTYPNFIKTIDTVVLGANTYHQIINELSPDVWPYEGMISYIITSKSLSDKDNIKFTNELIPLVKQLKEQDGKDIWICGGANIVNQLVKANLIDTYMINIIPTILGDGIRLFDSENPLTDLKFIKTSTTNGMTEVVYEKK